MCITASYAPLRGTITTFDAPGAGTGSDQGTFPPGHKLGPGNRRTYVDTSGVYHGFLRSSGGTFKTLHAPGAGTGAGQGTEAGDINTKGEILGAYIDSSGTNHGYVRSPGGKFTEFDAPGAGTDSGQGTFPAALCGLTDTGAVAGEYIGTTGVYHVFLRTPAGTFSTIDPSGSVNTMIAGP